jgi:hypothetical protein
VDDLFSLPDWGVRAEVLDGRLLLAPPPPRRQERIAGNLAGSGVGPVARLPGAAAAITVPVRVDPATLAVRQALTW